MYLHDAPLVSLKETGISFLGLYESLDESGNSLLELPEFLSKSGNSFLGLCNSLFALYKWTRELA